MFISIGWISLHREIRDHWLYKEPRTFSRFEAWIDLIFMACYKNSKSLMEDQLIEVKRGSMVTSIKKLCEQWKWSNNKVKGFLDMLTEDGMITYKQDSWVQVEC